LRVTAQLIGVRDGSHLWSETYDENTGDVLQVQDRIASGLVRALQVTIGADDLLARPLLKNADAYDQYLRGRHSYDRFDEAGFAGAVSYFQKALKLDPASVRAAEWLALTYESIGEWGFSPPREVFEKARAATAHALELDPGSARAHATICAINTIYDWDWDGAMKECRRALEIEPGNPYVLSTYDQLLITQGQTDAGERAIDEALSIDPMDASTHTLRGNLLRHRGALSEAETEFRKALDISPGYVAGHWYLGLTLLKEGKVEAARDEMQHEVSFMSRNAGLGIIYHAMNRDDLSDAALAKVTDDWAYEIAPAYAYRGDKARALQWLDRAYDLKDPSLAFLKVDVLFDGLAADPGFKALLRKMNLPD
jgi:tetratricopeptide (TPR) repeat protein